MRINTVLSYSFVLLSCVFLISCSNEDRDNLDIVFDPDEIFNQKQLIAHRGLANYYPENTFEAIEAAIKYGFRWIECDVAITKDGIPVLSHDWTIDRCSSGSGTIYEMTYDELMKYDFGSWKGDEFAGIHIPKLLDVLKLCKRGGAILELDIADERNYPNPEEALRVIYETVKENGMLSNTVFTTKYQRIKDFINWGFKDLNVSIAWTSNIELAKEARDLVGMVNHINFSTYLPYLTPEIVEFAHTNGIKMKTWPASSQEEIDEAYKMGVDYIITDFY